MLDDDRWKAVTTVGYLAHPETLKHRPCRSHAVNVTMPLADIEHGVGVSGGTHFRQRVNIDFVTGALHLIRSGYALASPSLGSAIAGMA